jgi:hypothetical protein
MLAGINLPATARGTILSLVSGRNRQINNTYNNDTNQQTDHAPIFKPLKYEYA